MALSANYDILRLWLSPFTIHRDTFYTIVIISTPNGGLRKEQTLPHTVQARPIRYFIIFITIVT